MNKVITLLVIAFLMLTNEAIFAQVNYTANDLIVPYEGYYHPGINLGYYGPEWDDNELADLAAGNETVGIPGIGIKSLRGSLPEGLGLTFTYDIWINKYNYNNAVGTTDNLLFLGFASEEHKDPVDYCPSDNFQTDMFANLYEPIWDNGENGTPVNDENYYALYVYEVVSRLKDKVKFWEIWNEPGFDFSGAKGFLQPGQPGNWWENNPDPCDYKLRAPIFHYIRTLRISYEVIKSIAPDDYVCVAGVGYNSFLDAILRNTDNPDDGKVTAEYPLGGGAYFDVIGFHAYPHIDGSTRYWDNDLGDFVFTRHSDAAADALNIRTDERQEVLERYGYDGVTYPKKEWIATEVNVPSTAFSQDWGSEEAQRNYVMKVNIEAMELDFTQLHLFLLADLKPKEEAGFEFDLMGMYESLSDRVPYQQITKESGIGLKTMSDALFGTRYDAAKTAEMNIPENVDGGAFLHEDGTYTYTLWAKTQTDLSEEAFANYTFPQSFGLTAMIRKEWDFSQTNSRIAEASGGIQLTGSPIFLRRLEEDQDIFLNVSCDMGVEIQVTATTPEGGQIVTWPEPTAQTNCTGGVRIEQTQGIPNGEFFPFGVSEIQYTITNECGDVKYCAFNVKVASTGGGIGDCNLFRWEMGFVGQFEGNKYFVSKVQKDFAGAQAQCEGHGGYLVSIDSPEENEFLRQQVNDLAMIGYNDVAQEGMLEWTSGKEVVFTNVADCQGCQNSEFGDVAIFNHFNGEWYFESSDFVGYFIMELPCAEVDPCICTTEYDPVCAPDGTEYSNSCFAECAGVFDYGGCAGVCDFTQFEWYEDIIDIFGCENLNLVISTVEINNASYLIVDDGSSVAVDGGYIVYDCEQNLVCTESGFGSPLCLQEFGDDFLLEADTIYDASRACAMPCVCTTEYDPVCGPDGTEYSNSCIAECEGVFDYGSCTGICDLSELTWLAEYIETQDCNQPNLVISGFESNGSTYVLLDNTEDSAPGGYVVFDCSQNLMCVLAEPNTECTNLFGQNFTDTATIYWSAAEECAEPCILEDQAWYQELLQDTTLCNNACVPIIETFEFGDSSYVAFIGHLGPCADFFTEIYNCEQTLICKEGGFAGLSECSTLFGEDFPANSEVIWSREDCPVPCTLENMDWLDEKIEATTCDDCIEGLYSFEYNDSTFVIEIPDVDACDDSPLVIYDCNGGIFCTEGGEPGSTACSEYFGLFFDPALDTLWDRSLECFDCDLDEQVWLDQILDTISCLSCIENLLVFEFGDSAYVATVQEDLDCGGYELTIFNCEGNIICIEGGENSSEKCTEIFGEGFDPDFDIIWSNEEECPDCELEDQEWLQNKLDSLDCRSCTRVLSIIELDGIEYILELTESASTNIECSMVPQTMYDCNGNIVCQDISDTQLDCQEILENSTVGSIEVLWNKEAECECDLENQAWLDSLLAAPSLCEDCISSIETYSYGDYEYVVAFADDENCADALTTGYRCDGSILCYNGGFAGLSECDLLLGLGNKVEVLWEKDSITCMIDAVNNLQVQNLDLFPNPTDDDINISFSALENLNLQYSVFNIIGQEILNGTYNATAGENNLNIQLGNMESGIYLVSLVDTNSGREKTLKFVVE